MNSALTRNGIFFSLVIIAFFQQPVFSTILISPANSKINYYGRIDFSKPESPQYNWSGVVIEANFTGTEIGMKIAHTGSYYDIEIDGKTDTVISVKNPGEYLFRKNLSDESHRLRIKLRSEDHYTVGTFMGLLVADGNGLEDLPPKSSRKIEFIGDSYTAGYGIESPGTQCSEGEVKTFTNVFKAFTSQVTEAFHAQNFVMGWSGAGMVRNYGAGSKRSAEPYPFYYDFTFGAAENSPHWDYSQWKPELVVICLGTNDYSTTPHPDDSMYVGDYHKFIARILNNYPDASILCVSTGDATFEKNVKRVVAEQKSIYNNSEVYFAPYPTGLKYNVCHSHPSADDNTKVAKVLIDTIMKNTGWDTTSASVERSYTPPNAFSAPAGFHIIQSNGAIYMSTGFARSEKIDFFSVDGKKVLKIFTDEKGKCGILKSSLIGKSFVIGNSRLGWRKVITLR